MSKYDVKESFIIVDDLMWKWSTESGYTLHHSDVLHSNSAAVIVQIVTFRNTQAHRDLFLFKEVFEKVTRGHAVKVLKPLSPLSIYLSSFSLFFPPFVI